MEKRASAVNRCRICFVVSSALTASAFLPEHLRALGELYDVDLVINSQENAVTLTGLKHAALHRAPIVRSISPLADIRAIADLTRIFRSGRYAAVQSITPKAGLLTAIAGFIARVPVRVHMFTGQVWATAAGMRRGLLRAVDRAIVRLNTHIVVDSASQRDFLRAEKVLGPEQGEVFGDGSVCGVDPERFKPDAPARDATRAKLGIPTEALVFLFVGRLTREKGTIELAHAFAQIAATHDNAYLVFVGPDEEGLQVEVARAAGAAGKRLRFVALSPAPEHFMAASDVFCLPSYREGFGSVVIEAAAAGLPAIGSRIYGLTDAIVEDVTGLLVEPRDPDALAAAMARLAGGRALRERLGSAARERALRDFAAARVTGELVRFYARVLPDCSR